MTPEEFQKLTGAKPLQPKPFVPPPAAPIDDPQQKDYTPNKKMTKEEILSDPQSMTIIKNFLRNRHGVTEQDTSTDFTDKLRMGAGWLAGQRYGTGDIDGMSNEELFEMYQNHMRSFAGGQSVTVGAEVAFLQNATPEQKAAVGQGYALFDSMPGIFDEDTSWSEMFDGIGDYTRAAIWDPATLIGFGTGRAIGSVGSKATAQGLKQAFIEASKTALKGGASREVARQAGKKAVSEAFKTKLKQGVVTTGALTLTDLPFAVGADVGWQWGMLETGQQEEWSKSQTAISALGSLILPATYAGFKGVQWLSGTEGAKIVGADRYTRISQALRGQMDKDSINKTVLDSVDKDLIQDRLGILFADFRENFDQYSTKLVSDQELGPRTATIGGSESDFFKALMLGDSKRGIDGMGAILRDAGMFYVPRWSGDTPSQFFGDMISQMPKESWQRVAEEMSLLNKVRPDVLPKDTFKNFSSEELGEYFIKRSSNLGRDLGVISGFSRIISKKSPDVADATKGLIRIKSDAPRRMQFVQNMYKRLLTSHPGTTGLNLKGWSATTAMNTAADIVEGALYVGTAPFVKGNWRKGVGSISGAIRRGYNIGNWIDSVQAAEDYLSVRPEIRERLFQFVAGGVENTDDVAKQLKRLNLDPKSKLNLGVESATSFAQTMTGVKLQDEITKNLSFISSIDQEIRKKYGMTFNEFVGQKDAWVKMGSPEFKLVEKTALERTLRESYSKPFSMQGSDGLFREVAKGVEKFSNTPGLGFLVPFGQFFNNATATLADYSGLNFVRHMGARAIGQTIDYSEEQGMSLLAKGVVGWTAFGGYFIPNAEEKVEEGLKWSQQRRSDGSISDETYNFPMSAFLVSAQLFAHSRLSGEIPPDLAVEAGQILGGQLTRDLVEAGDGVGLLAYGLLDYALGSGDAVDLKALEVIGDMGARIISGFTRPLDPINQFTALMTDSFETPDRRQGVKFLNNSLRYVDQMFDTSTTDTIRRQPFNKPADQDVGRVLLGNRTSQPPSTAERMLAAVGKPSWRAIRWEGDNPEHKNRLDAMIQPIIDNKSKELLQKYPDFFTMSLGKKEAIVSRLLSESKKEVKGMIDQSVRPADVIMSKVVKINGYSDREIKRALKTFGFDGSLDDIIDTPNADQALDSILDYLQNQDMYMGLE